MRVKPGRVRVAGERCRGWWRCIPVAAVLIVLPAWAYGSEQPQEALLDFLGSGLMGETGEDWLDFLDSLANDDTDAVAGVDEPVFQGETHEQE